MKKIILSIGILMVLIVGVMINFPKSSAESPTFMREVLPNRTALQL